MFKQKVVIYANYDEIKQELKIMKYVEFGDLDDNTSDTDSDNWSFHESEGVHLPNLNADKANA
ncbi:hypothetical protein J3R82DRAFT_10281 [Butyriboletus roseoflavus]|nr:hypothetical protein J3R82DRAFT_10281 [Butyriboletus roseoflavus]